MTPKAEAIIQLTVLAVMTLGAVALGRALRHRGNWSIERTERIRDLSIAGIIVVFIGGYIASNSGIPTIGPGALIYFPCVCWLTMACCKLADFRKACRREPSTSPKG